MVEAGDTLDHYRLDERVGRGGMATLFKATDLSDGRTVALKIPNEELASDAVLIERFERERAIGQELDHPGIVKTFAEAGQSRPYTVIEWVEGTPLRAILNQTGSEGERRLAVERATDLALQILDALDAMHKHGVVHRDLKPENVMVNEEDRIKLIDFGIALREDARRITFVEMSPMLGTPDYIAPEQVKGQRGDQRSDIYALGAMLYEMLAGEPPFSGPNPLAVMNARVLHDAPAVRKRRPEVSRELEEIVNRALVRDPRRRYQTASEMAIELEHQERVSVGMEAGTPPRASKLPGGRRLLLYAALALGPVMIFALMMVLARR
jgi:serine/threonine protein kinase